MDINNMTKQEIVDYYENLIIDIQKLRKTEFNAVYYGIMAIMLGVIGIGVAAYLW